MIIQLTMFILLSGHSFLRCSKWRVSWRWFARTSSRRRELDQTICHCSSSLTFKSHYPRVESDLRYSEPHVAKTSPLSSAQLTKSRQKWETTWPIKHGQSVAQKAVRNMSTKDNGVRAHFGQSNFPFSQQKRKKEILLILIIFTYFKVQTKIEKEKMVRKIDHFFIFLILKSASKIQKIL